MIESIPSSSNIQENTSSKISTSQASPTSPSLDGTMICPLPEAYQLPRSLLFSPFRALMNLNCSLTRRVGHWITWLFTSPAVYEESCNRETYQFMQHMWKVYQDDTHPLADKALLLEAISAYGLASRPTTPYAAAHTAYETNSTPAKPIPLPIYRTGLLCIEPCVLIKEVFLYHIPIRIFAPVNGHGSPLYLFPPTMAWPKAPDVTTQILDDINPLGPGTFLQHLAKKTLPPLLTTLVERYREKAYFVGQSLGGILATAVALELPHLVQRVCAFSPTRPFPSLIKKWEALQSLHHSPPHIHTYIPKWNNGEDPITYLGGNWIGTVHCIRHAASCNVLDRHVSFLLPKASQSLHLESCDPALRSPKHVSLWIALHRVIATCVLIISLLFLGIKRLLVGWKQGKLLRWGILGLPIHAVTYAWKMRWTQSGCPP